MINNKNFSFLLIVFILWYLYGFQMQCSVKSVGFQLTNLMEKTALLTRSVVWNNAWNCRPDHLLTSALHHYHFIQKQMRYVPLCCLIFDINQG